MGNRTGLALTLKCDTCSQTALSRLASGHIKCLSFSANKIFSLCPRCQDHQASPEYIMYCTSKDIYMDHLLVLYFLRFNDFIDLV
ncbi:hypothetical protein NPIL_305071 [Nephila pilipes]|uniref:Uncharacterized protein n=1 Tax=Nephila pilipes TaxID=299642 RepID=A0A8X6TC30_NEPPI|nr:hypothetical protein NPIL_305071 [Nephila pilipes]